MEDFNYLYILDYSDATICEIILTKEDKEMELCDVVEKYGCNVNTCNWMTTKNRILGITTLNNDVHPLEFV